MPFLAYHRLEKLAIASVRSARGYAAAIDIWDRLGQIIELGKTLGLRNWYVRRSTLAAGPCPGPWRVYYTAILETVDEEDEILTVETYLGNNIGPRCTKRHLGKLFEKWISHANAAYNEFLSSQSMNPLDAIPGVVGQYYSQNAKQHLKEASPAELLECILSIDPRIKVLETLPFQLLTPDGIFSQGSRAAIFESKLSDPTYDAFPHDMAIYALAYEKESKKDVDYAIITHSDYPTGSEIIDKLHQISDSVISQIVTNLENFVRLIQFSSEHRRAGVINQLKARARYYGSWKSFLERPPGLPPDFNRSVCPRCPFQARCYAEGAES